MIELLIVLAIMSTLMGLVGPLAIDSYEKAQAKTEMYSLNNYINKLSYEAFAQGQKKIIKLKGRSVSIFSGNEQEPGSTVTFAYLFFQPQSMEINSNGFSLTRTLAVQIRGKTQHLALELAAEDKDVD